MGEKATAPAEVSVDAVMADVQDRVRERLREHILRHGASRAFEDPQLFAEVERVLFNASDVGDPGALILPTFLGDPETWHLETAIRYKSHRGGVAGERPAVREAAAADAGGALPVRVQPRQLRAAAAGQPRAHRLRSGIGHRDGAPEK